MISIRKKMMLFLLGGALIVGNLIGCGADSGKKEVDSVSSTSEESVTTSSSEVEATREKTTEEMLQIQPVKTIEDTEYIRIRKTFFGNLFDPQTMNWPELYTVCYEGLYSSVQQEGMTYYRSAGAENTSVSEDGLTVTFYLRRDAKWSDRQAVTAGDYEFAWKHLLDPVKKFEYAFILDNVQGAEAYRNGEGSVEEVGIHALDAYTLQVTLNSPDPEFYKKTVSPALYPLRQEVADAIHNAGRSGISWTSCIFNGPYVITDYEVCHYVALARNELYWDQVDVSGEKVLWYLETNDKMAETVFDEGHLDVLTFYSEDDQKLEDAVAAGQLGKMTVSTPELSYLSFNFAGPAGSVLENRSVRQALSLSLNRENLAAQVGQIPAYGLVPSVFTVSGLGYRALQSEPLAVTLAENYAEDEEALGRLMRREISEEELSGLHLIILSYETDLETQKILTCIQADWQNRFGITVEIRYTDSYADFKEARAAGDYDMIYQIYGQFYDDILSYMNFYRGGNGANNGSYDSSDYNDALDSAAMTRDTGERVEYLAEAEADLVDECAFLIPLAYGSQDIFYKNYVKGLLANPFYCNPDTMYVDYTAWVEAVDAEKEAREQEAAKAAEEEKKKKGTSLFTKKKD